MRISEPDHIRDLHELVREVRNELRDSKSSRSQARVNADS
jgi:hypothetical protein